MNHIPLHHPSQSHFLHQTTNKNILFITSYSNRQKIQIEVKYEERKALEQT